jgi:3-oxoacyl-[acyl-carrier-protein] synthase II
MTRRVVITGVGVVTPFGDLAQSRASIREGRSALAPTRAFDATPFAESRAGECVSFDPLPWFRNPKALKIADRRTRLAVAAAGMAVANARLDPSTLEGVGVVVGTSGSDVQTESCATALGSPDEGDAGDIDYFGTKILRRLHPLWLLVNLANMASAHIAIQLEARGPNSTICTDWIAGLQAIGEAARWIADGEAEVAIAGGADCGILPFAYACLEDEGLFTSANLTFVPAEGAALFAIESLEHAQARGAHVLAEISGYACANGDRALESSMRRALAKAEAKHVDLLCDAAVFVPRHQHAEEEAIRNALAIAPARFECTSRIGHAFAAASPIALAVALEDSGAHDTLLVNAIGVMGQAASLVIQKEPIHADH